MTRLVFDVKLRRPACALVGAAFGGDPVWTCFPAESWLLTPTPDMQVYDVDAETLDRIVATVWSEWVGGVGR